MPRVIARSRYFFDHVVPFVENLVGSTFTVVADENGNAKASIRRGGKDQPEIEISGPGTIWLNDYESKFESACRARDKAISNASLDELHTAVIKGIASIESYVSRRVDIWNGALSQDLKLAESKSEKVSFEKKIKDWIPLIAHGARLDLSGVMWADFKFLQAIRDNDAVHAKKFANGASFDDLAVALNKFKFGIADFLLQLHIVFGEAAPRAVIRARYFPEIYVQKARR